MSSDVSGGSRQAPRVVAVGVGNLLLGDEGLGIHAIRALAARASVRHGALAVIDAGTALFDVLPDCRDADLLVIVDAMRAGRAPGTVYRLPLDAGSVSPGGASRGCELSLHDWTVLDTLSMAAGLGLLPGRVVLLGIEPASLEPGTSLSPDVASALETLLDAVEREAATIHA